MVNSTADHILKPLQNTPFCPISRLNSIFNLPANFCGLIVEIPNVFLWLKLSLALNLKKDEKF
jgi:hypothetical protein